MVAGQQLGGLGEAEGAEGDAEEGEGGAAGEHALLGVGVVGGSAARRVGVELDAFAVEEEAPGLGVAGGRREQGEVEGEAEQVVGLGVGGCVGGDGPGVVVVGREHRESVAGPGIAVECGVGDRACMRRVGGTRGHDVPRARRACRRGARARGAAGAVTWWSARCGTGAPPGISGRAGGRARG